MIKYRKKYIATFGLKIAAIVVLAFLSVWLVYRSLYISASFVFLLIIALAVSIYRARLQLIRRITEAIRSIRADDFSSRLVSEEATSGKEMQKLMEEMNEALAHFRTRTHEAVEQEAETAAWQKLISVLTHEIMNSMTPIISLSETMSERQAKSLPEDYETMRSAMEIIHRRSEGLLAFINNYRRLTRLPEPKIATEPLEPLFSTLHRLLKTEGIRFDYEVYPDTLTLDADREMLEQMLINLIRNAGEAATDTSQEIEIKIRAQMTEQGVQITVRNNGPEIPPDTLERIFIPFYSTKAGGSGIGLSLCRQIMHKHGGSISATSAPGNTSFILRFPRHKDFMR